MILAIVRQANLSKDLRGLQERKCRRKIKILWMKQILISLKIKMGAVFSKLTKPIVSTKLWATAAAADLVIDQDQNITGSGSGSELCAYCGTSI